MQKLKLEEANLFDAASVLFHRYLLRRALEAEKGLNVQTRLLFEARPVHILRMNLWERREEREVYPSTYYSSGDEILN